MSDQLWTVLSSTITALLVVFFVDRIKAQADLKRAGGDERKSSSDAIESATRANIALNDPLTRRVTNLEAKITRMEIERANSLNLIEKMTLIIDHLCLQMDKAGINPEIDRDELERMIALVKFNPGYGDGG
jgi:hypothetical protein